MSAPSKARPITIRFRRFPRLSSALHQRIRVGGDVKDGSIQHYSGRIDFVLVEQGKTMPVSYVGTDPLPDTFKDGAQCLVEGKVQPDGRFVAETIQAKCASKYEAAPGGQAQPGNATGGISRGKG